MYENEIIEEERETCEHGMDAYLCGGPMHWYDETNANGMPIKHYLTDQRCNICGFTTFDSERFYIHTQGDCGGDQ